MTPPNRESLEKSQMGMLRTQRWTMEPSTDPYKGRVGDHGPLGCSLGVPEPA